MSNKSQDNTEFSNNQYSFTINSNNLIPLKVIDEIIKTYPSSFLKQLEGVITEICILVGGYQRQYYILPDKEVQYKKYERFLYSQGYSESEIKDRVNNARSQHSPYNLINKMNLELKKNDSFIQLSGYHEFNLETRVLYFYMYKVFKDATTQWEYFRTVGAVRRQIYQQLYSQLLKCLIEVVSIKNYLNYQSLFLSGDQVKTPKITQGLVYETEEMFQKKEIPINMGFLDYLYYRYMDLKGIHLERGDRISYNRRHTNKFFNEMRRLKFKYKYEHTFSELINYCLHKRPFKKYIEANSYLIHKKWYKNPLYFQCKQCISKYLIEKGLFKNLKEYRDSSNRKFLFMSHNFFENIKKACLQECIEKISYPELLLYNKFIESFSICPECAGEVTIGRLNSYFFNKTNNEILRKSDQSQLIKELKIFMLRL